MEVWTEKYRPRTLRDIVLPDTVRVQVEEWLKNPNALPNLLLASFEPGTGKTSLARLIISLLKADSIELNASDERGIQTVRDTITAFVTSRRLNQSSPKIVLLDEADYLTDEAQATLRHLMEDVMTNARFILTCNNQSKIIAPLVSRCYLVQLSRPPREKVFERLQTVLAAESVQVPNELLEKVVDRYYPSLREMICWLQQWHLSGGKLEINVPSNIPEQVWDLIKQKKVKQAREVWLLSGYNLSALVSAFSGYISTLPPEKWRLLSFILAKYDYRMAVGADPEVQMTAMAWELSDNI